MIHNDYDGQCYACYIASLYFASSQFWGGGNLVVEVPTEGGTEIY
jgi:hypothetical protein